MHEILIVGKWQACRATGQLICPEATRHLEPKVMDLLFLLSLHPNQVVFKEELLEQLWPGLIVGEDTLARLVSRLRKALGDDSKSPQFIETIPKRGYRLVIPVEVKVSPHRFQSPLRILIGVLATATLICAISTMMPERSSSMPEPRTLVKRADEFYFQYSRANNEAAIELYEQAMHINGDYAPAYAGLANALAQRAIRWPTKPDVHSMEYTKLSDALKGGYLVSASSQQTLGGAQQMAERAIQLAPASAASYKALGLVLSAKQNFSRALEQYRKALQLDPDAWGVMINTGDVLELSGQPQEALRYFEMAYDVMTRLYEKQTSLIRPWYADLATLIGDRNRSQDRTDEAAEWYRRALNFAPLNPSAVNRLASLLREQGAVREAQRLCNELQQRIGFSNQCASRQVD